AQGHRHNVDLIVAHSNSGCPLGIWAGATRLTGEVAELADLHRNYRGGVERGERNVSLLNIVKLAHGLNVRAIKRRWPPCESSGHCSPPELKRCPQGSELKGQTCASQVRELPLQPARLAHRLVVAGMHRVQLCRLASS